MQDVDPREQFAKLLTEIFSDAAADAMVESAFPALARMERSFEMTLENGRSLEVTCDNERSSEMTFDQESPEVTFYERSNLLTFV